MSINNPTISQLQIACRHVDELMADGMTENLAIRILEILVDCYGQFDACGTVKVHSAKQVPQEQWSVAARRANRATPDAKHGSHLRVEHGTPRRTFARKVRQLYKNRRLTAAGMARLSKRLWKLAVITHDEDKALNRLRNMDFKTPQSRWAAAGITFTKNSPCALAR